MFDVNSRESFNNLDKWLKEYKEFAANETVMILVGNKTDLKDRKVSKDEAKRKAKSINARYYELSTHNEEKVDEMFEDLFLNALSSHFPEYSKHIIHMENSGSDQQNYTQSEDEKIEGISAKYNSEIPEPRVILNAELLDTGGEAGTKMFKEESDGSQSDVISINYSQRNIAASDGGYSQAY